MSRIVVVKVLMLISFFILGEVCAQRSFSENFESETANFIWRAQDIQLETHFVNPFKNQNNNSDFVLQYQDTGGAYANIGFDYDQNFDLSGNHQFSLKIYVPSALVTGNSPNQISLKLQNGNLGSPWPTQTEIIKSITLDQWQTISFDFNNDNYFNLDQNSPPPSQRNDLNRIVLQVNGENNSDHVVAYIDDFAYTSDSQSDNGNDPVYDNLVWQDEFDYNGAVDPSKWFHQTQLPQGNSWFNGEIQHYTDRIENAEVSNGTLNIKAKAELFTDQGVTKNYTSARLNSKYAFTYGKVEIRAKLPTGVGTWPALWLLGQNINEDGAYWDNQGYGTTNWPACGEIDIMEHWGDNQNYVSSAIHTPSSYGGTVNHGGQYLQGVSDDFHVYTMIWTPDDIEFKVDGVTHYTYYPYVQNDTTWPFDEPQYLLFNVAILPEISPTFTQSDLEVDYVRIYQESLSNDSLTASDRIKVYPNPADNYVRLKNASQVKTYILFNQLGQKVQQGSIDDSKTLSIENIQTGIYLLKLKNKQGFTSNKRIIKK
jgi:beta-glucanase (GH16 family)